MVNKKFLILAVVLGLITTLAVNQYIKKQVGSAKKIEIPTYPVVIAKVNIKTRAVIKKEMVELKKLPRQYIIPDAVTSLEDAIGKVSLSPFFAGEQLLKGKIREKGSRLGLSFKIPENKRAVAIRVAGAAGIAGLVQPGDLVDVLLTYNNLSSAGSSIRKTKTVTVLQNVQVLAIDQVTESFDEESSGSKGGGIVTFALTLEEAEILTLANSKGQLSLALRAFNDKSKVKSSGAEIEELLNPGGVKKKTTIRRRPRSQIIEVIKGTKTDRVRVR